ncbi:cytidylyltransferase domain-containing protein [Aeromicrobium sp. CTD01-1L150]|uniref:cytidylyltransferase domain-containing protein n=1 Tax=Aeromicrobium sp. CTD01-1L150 TaxID=3341830 RepID=UPI0035C105A4
MTLQHLTVARRPASPPTLAPTADVCAIIPARGGSKGVPRKNLRTLGGEPLVVRAVRTVRGTPGVDVVMVSTDDVEIAYAARGAGARIVDRPAQLSGDLATSESAIQHTLAHLAGSHGDGPVPGIVLFVQATSPFIDPDRLAEAIAAVRDDECDVAFSVTRTHAHVWRHGDDGPEGVNHDVSRRHRRQDRAPEFIETGAFYVMRTDGFLEHGHRFFGRLKMVEVDSVDALEIDTEHDLRLAEELLLRREAAGTDTASAPIRARAVVTDFDGVHTDDSVRVDSHGVESVVVSRSDGMGVARLRRAGRPILILSTETNPVVAARAEKLGVDAITGCSDKVTALREWARENDVGLHDIAYLGNDVNDVEALAAVGWPVVPADAHPACRVVARHVLRHRGGAGAVRELADRVLAPKDLFTQDSTQQKGPNHG